MTPQYPFQPFAVNICGHCWSGASWDDSDEFGRMLSRQRYIAEGNMVGLHLIRDARVSSVVMVCDTVFALGTTYLSLIEMPMSKRIPPRAASLKDSLRALQEEIDDSVAVLARGIEIGLESIALAIRDQGPRS